MKFVKHEILNLEKFRLLPAVARFRFTSIASKCKCTKFNFHANTTRLINEIATVIFWAIWRFGGIAVKPFRGCGADLILVLVYKTCLYPEMGYTTIFGTFKYNPFQT